MKRPSFQFYPADWQANSNLRRCTHEEKGVWMDVMCLLHDQEEYGVVRWPLREIAQAVGCTLAKLQGIVTKGILKGSDDKLKDPYIYIPRSARQDGDPVILLTCQEGPIWYSSRMVKDEYVKKHAGAATRFGSDGKPPKKANPVTQPSTEGSPSHSPSQREGEYQSDGSSTSSSSSSSNNKKTSFSSDDMRLAEYLFEHVKIVAPDTKKPNLEAWANTIRLMREQDDLTLNRIATVFAWANRDPFWKTNILSAEKLRKQFPQLAAKMEESRGKRNQSDRPSIDKASAAAELAFGNLAGSGEILEGDFNRVDANEAAH